MTRRRFPVLLAALLAATAPFAACLVSFDGYHEAGFGGSGTGFPFSSSSSSSSSSSGGSGMGGFGGFGGSSSSSSSGSAACGMPGDYCASDGGGCCPGTGCDSTFFVCCGYSGTPCATVLDCCGQAGECTDAGVCL